LVDDAIAASLASVSGFEMSALWRRTLRGIGPVTPWSLSRADPSGRRGMIPVPVAVAEAGADGKDEDDGRDDDRDEDDRMDVGRAHAGKDQGDLVDE